MDLEKKLEDLGYELPSTSIPVASYTPYLINGNSLYISGQIPILNHEVQYKGHLGSTVDLETGQAAARLCALNILAQVNEAVEGDWLRVDRCVKLGGFVACIPEFTNHSKVINGASDFLIEVMGDAGRHTRYAVGVLALPLGVCVEIDAIFSLKPVEAEEVRPRYV